MMQSDGKFFCWDVILDTFNKASHDEDNILDQTFGSKSVRNTITMILILDNINENAC